MKVETTENGQGYGGQTQLKAVGVILQIVWLLSLSYYAFKDTKRIRRLKERIDGLAEQNTLIIERVQRAESGK